MKRQILRITVLVFALFITAGITSCKVFPEAEKEVPEKKAVSNKATVKKAVTVKKTVKKGVSESEELLQTVNKEWSGKIKCEDIDGKACAVVDNNKTILSKKWTPVQAGKQYNLSGSFKSLGKSQSKVYYGFICYDKKRRQIGTLHSNIISGSGTTLAKACKKGDKLLVLKANKKWKKGNYAVAFNAKDDFSDLPNREVAYKITKVTQKGGNIELQLHKPLKKAYAAGTKVRMHTASYGSYLYTAICGAAVPKSWKTYKGSAALAKPGQMGWHYIRPGTAYVRIVILPNYRKKKDEKLAFKDLKLQVK